MLVVRYHLGLVEGLYMSKNRIFISPIKWLPFSSQHRRHFEAERLCSLLVDDELELVGLLDWNVRGLLTPEDSIGIDRGMPKFVSGVDAPGHQPTARDVVTIGIDRRQSSTRRKLDDAFAEPSSDLAREHEKAGVRPLERLRSDQARPLPEAYDGSLDLCFNPSSDIQFRRKRLNRVIDWAIFGR